MPPRSLRELHPEEVRRFAKLLKHLQQASGLTQRDLAARLHHSPPAMSRYLSGQEVLPAVSLDPFLDHTNASVQQRQQARALMSAITGTSGPPKPPRPPAPPIDPSSPNRSRHSTNGRLRTHALRVGLAAVVVYPALVASGALAIEAPVSCPGPQSSLPTAWAATCTGRAVFDRAQRVFVVSDLDGDGKSVLLQVSLNGGEPTNHYNSTGLTTVDNPPKHIPKPLIDNHATVRFWVCLVNRNAPRAEDRRPGACGNPVTDERR